VSVQRRLRSKLLSAYISDGTRRRSQAWHEARRRLAGKGHVVHAFLQLDDPYSYLLSRYLPDLAAHYGIELQVYLSQALGGDYDPSPEMRADYAVLDCGRVAAELGVPFLDKAAAPPVDWGHGLADAAAAHAGTDTFIDELSRVLEIYWRGDAEAAEACAKDARAGTAEPVVQAAQRALTRMGHYDSAMLYYGGEWYRGIDRLHHLVTRLDELGLARHAGNNARLRSIRQVMQMDLPVTRPAGARELPPIDVFYSFRSPYSQLCLPRVCELADAFGLELAFRPVLPLMMRGGALPPRKIRYIIRDAMREAKTHGVPFGNAVDPLGAGVERCHAVFAYAQTEKREREFLLHAAGQIWGNAVDVATDRGMRKLTAKTGLFWPEVMQAMESNDWREAEAENRQLMLSLGSWGVPTLGIGDFVVWGQDRIWLLARHLQELCDTGEGILV
jgi:2-hydroxychromene-2-carboxylate isomerase